MRCVLHAPLRILFVKKRFLLPTFQIDSLETIFFGLTRGSLSIPTFHICKLFFECFFNQILNSHFFSFKFYRNLNGTDFRDIEFDDINRATDIKAIYFNRFYYCSMTPQIKNCMPSSDGKPLHTFITRICFYLQISHLFCFEIRSFKRKGFTIETDVTLFDLDYGNGHMRW